MVIEELKEIVKEYHAGQTRKFTGEPYYVHPFAVAEKSVELIKEIDPKVPPMGINTIYIAALFHDVVEDCFEKNATGFNELYHRFQTEIRIVDFNPEKFFAIVKNLTKIKGHNSRYRHLKYLQAMFDFTVEDIVIKLCDIENNLTSPEIAPNLGAATRRLIEPLIGKKFEGYGDFYTETGANKELWKGWPENPKTELMRRFSIAIEHEPDYLSKVKDNLQIWTYEKYQEYFTVLELTLTNNSIQFTKSQRKKLLEKINELREL